MAKLLDIIKTEMNPLNDYACFSIYDIHIKQNPGFIQRAGHNAYEAFYSATKGAGRGALAGTLLATPFYATGHQEIGNSILEATFFLSSTEQFVVFFYKYFQVQSQQVPGKTDP